MLQSRSFCFNPFQENTYVLWADSNECIIIDPGCHSKEEEKTLAGYITSQQLTPVAVWLTHCHIDHVLGLHFCEQTWNIPYFLSTKEIPQLKAVEVYAPAYGFHQVRLPENDGRIFNNSELKIGNQSLRVLEVPGHSPGHVAFYHEASKECWAGDVLFRQSIGRTDLPGGDFETLKKSILNGLYTLPEEVRIYPGHGDPTTIGFEKRNNPFVSLLST